MCVICVGFVRFDGVCPDRKIIERKSSCKWVQECKAASSLCGWCLFVGFVLFGFRVVCFRVCDRLRVDVRRGAFDNSGIFELFLG